MYWPKKFLDLLEKADQIERNFVLHRIKVSIVCCLFFKRALTKLYDRLKEARSVYAFRTNNKTGKNWYSHRI